MKIAVISTVYYQYSHTDVILTRWFDARAGDQAWGWQGPRSEVASAFVAQFPENDLARETFAKHNVPLCESVAEALMLGGSALAVDAVLLIGEHGEYPYNRFGQKLYPRKELFDKIVDVFEKTSRSVPVFCDKHLSWDFDLARLMIEKAQTKGFPLLSSSSLPFCHYEPFVDPAGLEFSEVVAVFNNAHGKPDHYGYHSLEFVQQFIEHRQGGESGVERVTAWIGDEVWRAQDAGMWSAALLEATLAATGSQTLQNYRQEDQREFLTHAFRLEYADGLRVTHVGLSDADAHTLAFYRKGSSNVEISLDVDGDKKSYYAHFATLSRVIEDFFWDGVTPFPPERSLLTAGALQAMIHAQQLPGTPFPTPHLKLAYQPSPTPVGLDYWQRDRERGGGQL